MIWLALLQFVFGVSLICWASNRCTRLDVAAGRRDRMALVDDYGSNRGWYFPWSPLAAAGFLLSLTAPITAVVGGF